MHHSIKWSALLALLVCTGCAAGSGRPIASDVEQQASADYTDCLDRAAHKLDDRASDVATIATAVRDTCLWQAHALEKAFFQGLTPEQREANLAKLATAESRQRAAVQAVLRERAGQ
jgi:outer membrane PBP1 activator LpoA protein